MKTLYIIIIILAVLLTLSMVNKKSLATKSISDPKDLEGLSRATFAGGCFWCMEAPFEQLNGVEAVLSGYSGGDEPDPTYQQVSSGQTEHVEAIQVYYDPKKVSYEELLKVFWRQIDPTDAGGQFVDRGAQYKSAIFYANAQEKKLAEKSKANLQEKNPYGKPIVTPILKFKSFHKAEEYHQDYHINNPLRYKYYRSGSGRDKFLDSVWGQTDNYEKPSQKELQELLTPIQYKVTQQN